MADRDRRARQRVDEDGVKTTDLAGMRASVWLLALAMGLVGIALFVVVRPVLHGPQAVPADAAAPEQLAKSPTARPRAPAKAAAAAKTIVPGAADRPAREAEPAARSHLAAPVRDADTAPEEQTAGAAPADSNRPTGIALFPPPGTKPILRGIVVPDDFELPPGYVRHYQTTDDGHQLPPILMFHPDYHPVGDDGAPISLPDDRVVPEAMAPAGMPVERLDVPENGPPPEGNPGRARNPSGSER